MLKEAICDRNATQTKWTILDLRLYENLPLLVSKALKEKLPMVGHPLKIIRYSCRIIAIDEEYAEADILAAFSQAGLPEEGFTVQYFTGAEEELHAYVKSLPPAEREATA